MRSMLRSVRFVTSKDGTEICTYSAGDVTKPAVVFVPGFGCTALAFVKQLEDPELGRHLHLIAYDVRGQGRSGAPLAAEDYVSARQAEDFKAVYDAYALNKPFIAGWSLGGVIPADIATEYGVDLIRGVILLGAIPYRMHHEVAHPHVLSFMPGLFSDDVREFSIAVTAFAESCTVTELPYDVKLAWIGAVAAQDPRVRHHILARPQDETALLRAADTLPILVLQGDKDLHILWEKLKVFMEARFKASRFELLEGVGHAPFVDQPERVHAALVAWVEGIVSA